jgi:hypothetical protein
MVWAEVTTLSKINVLIMSLVGYLVQTLEKFQKSLA